MMRDESTQTTRPLIAEEQAFLEEKKAKVRAQYGENRKITDGQYDKSLAVRCVNGTFVGRKSEGVVTYKGIPFVGKQPVGEYRWKAPVDFEPDDGVYEAYYSAKSAHQMLELSETAGLYYQGEDCLYLNIWTAGNADGEKKPVIVWIHGGGYVLGGTVEPMYDCYDFVKENQDVVYVSVPYRLGVFGFLHLSHLPDGADYPDAQNLGILDQIMALKWVHESIAGFGGDPERVTIFGESSGGGSVSLLPLLRLPENGKKKNTLNFINSNGELVNTYLKNHLVPVVEEPETERGDGKTPVIEVDGVKYTYLICADYTSNKYAYNGREADIFLNPSYDWKAFQYFTSYGIQARAIECGFSVLRNPVNGNIILYDVFGRPLHMQNVMDVHTGMIYLDIPMHGRQTFYGATGNWFPWICAAYIVLAVFSGFVVKEKHP